MVFTLLPFGTAVAAETGGICGEGLMWTLYDDGTLTINGAGEMTDYTYDEDEENVNTPWEIRELVSAVIIDEGVTSIGNYAFYDCASITNITIPSSVTRIGEYAFYNCSVLESISIPSSVTSIGDYAFSDCTGLTSVTYDGTYEDWQAMLIGEGNEILSSLYGGGYDPGPIDPSEMSFTVTFYDYDGNIFSEQYIMYGGMADDPGIPPCSDNTMTFNGWSEDFSYVTCDMYIYPNFIRDEIPIPTTYTVTFVDYDGSEIDSVTVNENEAVTEPEFTGTKENYTFTGWDKDFSCVTSDLTVTAQYERTVTASGDCGDNTVWKLYADGELEISGSGDTADYSCNYDSGKAYTPWVSYLKKIKKITVKDGITSIGRNLFAYCAYATEISIPNGVKSIGYGAFYGCTNLETVTIPNSVTSLGGRAFYDCSYIKSITLSENITSIGEYTFYRCYHLENMEIPSGVTSIGQWAFDECSALENIKIPESVTSIGSNAFYYCQSLKSISIPSKITSISDYMLWGCHALTDVTIPSGVTSIGSHAIQNCSGLKTVTIPESVTSIGIEAFRDCKLLENITIPSGVKKIDTQTFWGCSALKNITIPKSVTEIGSGAFLSCASLTDVYYGGTETEWNAVTIDTTNNECLTNATIHFNEESVEKNKYTVKFINYNGDVLKTETVTEGNAATAPDDPKRDGYTFIGWDVDFSNVVSDLTVTARFEKSATASGDINENVSWKLYTDGEFVINGSGSMGDFTATTVPWSEHRSKITKVTISDGITNIGAYAFYSCENLVTLYIPETVETIGDHAFEGCVKLADATIPDTLKDIGTDAFKGCTSMSYIPIPNKGTDIVAGEYENYTNIKNITIPEGVTNVGTAAFRNCSNATSVSIPNTLASIGENAFDGCTSITDVYYNGTQSDWENITIGDGNNCLLNANIHYLKLTVKFYGFNSVLLKTQTVDMNGAATAPEVPEVDGYTFNGWDKSFDSVTSDMTITAKYTSNSTVPTPTPTPTPDPTPSTYYTVTFVDYDGTVLKTENVLPGKDATAPSAPKRDGYTFTDWDKSFNAVNEDMTVTAQYVVNTPVAATYTVKFVDYDGTVLKTELVTAGENATAPSAPSREGYTFIGWDKTYTNITSDITITARYKEDENKKITVSKTEASSGDTVTVTVTADENIGMATGGIMINYDRTALELVTCEAGNLIKNASCVINKNRSDNGVLKLYVNFVGLDNIVAGGELLTMTFKVKDDVEDDAQLPITIDKITLYDNEETTLSVETVNGEIHVLNYELGDVNQNGTVDLLDVFAVMRYDVGLKELSASQKRAADVNGDGTVDIADAFLIQKYDAGLITGFAE